MRSTRCNRLTGAMILLTLATAAAVTVAQEHPEQTVARLRTLGQAMHLYANENKGLFPPDLKLAARYLGSAEQAAEIQRDVSYAVAPGTRVSQLKQPATVPVALAKPQAGGAETLAVLFADGRVQLYAAMSDDQRADAAMRARDARLAPRPAVTRPAAPAEPPDGDFAKALAGAWETSAGLHIAKYRFDADGTFTLTFVPDSKARPPHAAGAGKAAGTWRLDGARLVMTNTASDTPFTVIGEEEAAEIVRVAHDELVLRTKDRKGKEIDVSFARTIPFRKGQHENARILGTWHGDGITLVLADSGMAVFRSLKGEWSQRGDKLKLQFDGVPGPVQRQESLAFDIDLLNDTTLVLTVAPPPPSSPRERKQTYTLLRVK